MRVKDSKIFIREKEYPQIDNFVVLYVGVVLFFQTLLQISPIVTFLAATPLYSIQTYLGVLGGGLIVLDLFTTKRIWQGKYCLLLYGILVFAGLASMKMSAYGIKQNLFKLCWMAIQFCLVYSCAYRIPKEELGERIKTLFYALLTVWTFACCVSFMQYVNQYGYQKVVNPLAQDSSANWQGFYNNRLYGIFYTLNHAAYISLFFVIIAAVCILREKRVWVKLCLVVAQVALMVYIVLSGSRSTLVAVIACLFVAGFLAICYGLKKNSRSKRIRFCVAILLVIALSCVGYVGVKAGLKPGSSLAGTTETGKTVTNQGSAFDRENSEDVTNGRFAIWSDYISLRDEIGLTGLSPGNYMSYILENHSELLIAKKIKYLHPDKYASGIIYHVHSGYLMVYVSAGILGAIALAAFMVLCLIRMCRAIWKSKRFGIWFVCSLLLVVAGAISAVFDEGLFFQNNPQTTMFWFALGLLMRDCLADKVEHNN